MAGSEHAIMHMNMRCVCLNLLSGAGGECAWISLTASCEVYTQYVIEKDIGGG